MNSVQQTTIGSNYVIYWDSLTISTPTSKGPQAIKRVDRMGSGWFARFGTHDFVRISYEDMARYELATVEAQYEASDYGLGTGLEL